MASDPRFFLRPAETTDIEAMRDIERRATQIFRNIGYDFCADGPIRDIDEHARVQASGLTLIGITAAASAHAGAPAGFAVFEPLDGEAHLVEIDVDPSFQGMGLARLLIAAGEDWAQLKGFDGMTLTTYRDVPWNAPFYRRHGFAEFEPDHDRKGLRDTIEREAAWGFALKPRIAMRKRLR